jgi:hypothetical protein
MSGDELVVVARSLNAKLPTSMAIDVSPDRPDIFIRHSVEFIVGPRHTVPPALKAVKVQPDVKLVDFDASPPSSPLATKTRRAYGSRIAPERTNLHRLDEEECAVVFERPFKRSLSSTNDRLRSISMDAFDKKHLLEVYNEQREISCATAKNSTLQRGGFNIRIGYKSREPLLRYSIYINIYRTSQSKPARLASCKRVRRVASGVDTVLHVVFAAIAFR